MKIRRRDLLRSFGAAEIALNDEKFVIRKPYIHCSAKQYVEENQNGILWTLRVCLWSIGFSWYRKQHESNKEAREQIERA